MLSTHVLDTSSGTPAAGIVIDLSRVDGSEIQPLAAAITNADGRTDAPLAPQLEPGLYEIAFAVAPYFAERGIETFFDIITIRFRITIATRRYHVPLLLSPWSYTTYRGS